MHLLGYNVIRVFLDQGDGARTDGVNGNGSAPLGAEYVDNLASFIVAAGDRQLYTMITLSALPVNSYFQQLAPGSRTPNVGGPNV